MTYANEPTAFDELDGVDLDATTVEGASIALVLDGSTWKRGTVSGFDPDEPLSYFTMVDGDGEFWTVTISTSGVIGTTTFEPIATEAGQRITTEAGDVLVVE